MQQLIQKIETTDWSQVTRSMHANGHASIPQLLTPRQCEELKGQYDQASLFRKTVSMERHRFGQGDYQYYQYPLPEIIQTIRTHVYPHLVPIANGWFSVLKLGAPFPATHKDFLAHCHQNGQQKATALLLKYSQGGFNTLHQDLYGAIYFPIQVVIVLDAPGEDFTGGELVLTQQVPRAQSKATVLSPRQGDALIFTTQFKPAKGTRGYYRVQMKHGVSEVSSGGRHSLGIIFHDATH